MCGVYDIKERKGVGGILWLGRKPIDTNRYYVICSNVLGGYWGSTGRNYKSETNKLSFRFLSLHLEIWLKLKLSYRLLEIDYLHAIIGGSMGGMLTLK